MRRLFLAAILAAATLPAAAQTAPSLFKVVSPRDEIVIGLPAIDIDALGRKLIADGQIAAWQYAVRRGPQGTTEQGPLRRVVILRQDTLRIEAFDPRPLKVAPLPN
ncbi:MAG: hypothetical protein IT555_19030 [Acetobacteraceae bacterium]|nr:hypothetical protein [Acetobacteraceae bacterium]